MAKAIFTTKISPTYDDRPEERYHFPRTYLNQVRSAVGDHIIYYQPRRSSGEDSSRGGQQAYFATARVDSIIEDTVTAGHFYALISPSTYLDFDRPVPFANNRDYFESALRKSDGTTNKGAFGRAVRTIPDVEFDHILRAGFAQELAEIERPAASPVTDYFAAEPPPPDFVRPLVEMTVLKPFRERAFMRAVRNAYDNRCAMSGMRLINGGGRAEVQAAHIKPVAQNGPDSIRNGLALSGTLHWLFDRGLISVAENHEIIVSKKQVPDQVARLLNADRKLIVPSDRTLQPNPHYLKFHRECVFKP
jgi:putative restriction endonuclease